MTAGYPPAQERTNEPEHGGSLSSVGQLLGEISGDLSTLMRQEVELRQVGDPPVGQEGRQRQRHARRRGRRRPHGAAVPVDRAVVGPRQRHRPWLVGLVVAVIWAIIAAILALMGKSQLKSVQGLPKTTDTAKKIPDALKGNEDSR